MDNDKRMTLGLSDLNRVLNELDDLYLTPISEKPEETSPAPGPFNGLPRAAVAQELRPSLVLTPPPPRVHTSPSPSPLSPSAFPFPQPNGPKSVPRVFVRAPNSQTFPRSAETTPVSRGPSFKHDSDCSYDYLIQEMSNRFSNQSDGEYVDPDELDVFSPGDYDNDYVNVEEINSSFKQTRPSLQESPNTRLEPLPRLSLDSGMRKWQPPQNAALALLKSQTEPRRQTDPCINTNEDKQTFLRETSRKMSERSAVRKAIVNFYNEDESYKTIVVDEEMMAKDVLEILIMKNRISRKLTWQIFEVLKEEKLNRRIEDHEFILSIFECWTPDSPNYFSFRNNLMKFEFFQNPLEYVPDHMLEKNEKDKGSRAEREKAKEVREAWLREMAFTTDRFLEMEGLLWLKECGQKWKQAFAFVRTSRLYYSTKGKSKEPKHLRCLVDLTEVNIYMCWDDSALKKLYKAPTQFLIVFKKTEETEAVKDMVCICTQSEKNQKCFEQCLRSSKYGINQLRDNFNLAVQKHEKIREMRTKMEKNSKKKLFDDSVEKELASLCNQDWYYGEMSKDKASEHILRDREEGIFMVRKVNGVLYLSMFSNGKMYHYLIQAMEIELRPRYTMEEGVLNFNSLSELVQYYQSDPGSLPTTLARPPNRKVTRFPV